MLKQEFLAALQQGLRGLPEDDVRERLTFYGEMIDDRIEEGYSEEAAVGEMDSIDTIVQQTLSEIPLSKLVKEKVRPRRKYSAWEIVLIVLGFPVWLPLLIVAFALVLVLYVVIWVLVICLWAVAAALLLSAVAEITAGVILTCRGDAMQGLLLIAAGLLISGLSIFLILADIGISKGAARLTKKIALSIKSLFVRKERKK